MWGQQDLRKKRVVLLLHRGLLEAVKGQGVHQEATFNAFIDVPLYELKKSCRGTLAPGRRREQGPVLLNQAKSPQPERALSQKGIKK